MTDNEIAARVIEGLLDRQGWEDYGHDPDREALRRVLKMLDKTTSAVFTQDELEKITDFRERAKLFQSRGVPMNDDGTWQDGYVTQVELLKVDNEVSYRYRWYEQ